MSEAVHHSETAGVQPAPPRPVERGMEIFRPFMLLACVAFTVGFVAYWALAGVVAPSTEAEWTLAPADAAPARVAAPAVPAPAPELARIRHI